MPSLIIFISACLGVASSLIYIGSMLRGKTKPQRMTRFVVFVIVLVGTVGLYANHDSVNFLLYLIYSITNLLIFLFSLKYGIGGWNRTDITCLIISVIGIIVWKITDQPLVAISASIFANIVANVPAVIKTWKLPQTETWIYYFLGIFSNGIILFAQQQFTFDKVVFPAYFVLFNIAFVLLIFRPYFRARRTGRT